jgi:hypothetical protein
MQLTLPLCRYHQLQTAATSWHLKTPMVLSAHCSMLMNVRLCNVALIAPRNNAAITISNVCGAQSSNEHRAVIHSFQSQGFRSTAARPLPSIFIGTELCSWTIIQSSPERLKTRVVRNHNSTAPSPIFSPRIWLRP